VGAFLDLSDALHAHATELGVSAAIGLIAGWLSLRQPRVRASLISQFSRLPFIRTLFNFYRSGLFCRNLGILLGGGVNLTATLRILVDIMSTTGGAVAWAAAADRIRHGGKLSEGLAATSVLPPIAVRMLRLGEETGQLVALAAPSRIFMKPSCNARWTELSASRAR
jgi:general secretion pathway protein F